MRSLLIASACALGCFFVGTPTTAEAGGCNRGGGYVAVPHGNHYDIHRVSRHHSPYLGYTPYRSNYGYGGGYGYGGHRGYGYGGYDRFGGYNGFGNSYYRGNGVSIRGRGFGIGFGF